MTKAYKSLSPSQPGTHFPAGLFSNLDLSSLSHLRLGFPFRKTGLTALVPGDGALSTWDKRSCKYGTLLPDWVGWNREPQIHKEAKKQPLGGGETQRSSEVTTPESCQTCSCSQEAQQ